jgi:hypothetical protein
MDFNCKIGEIDLSKRYCHTTSKEKKDEKIDITECCSIRDNCFQTLELRFKVDGDTKTTDGIVKMQPGGDTDVLPKDPGTDVDTVD